MKNLLRSTLAIISILLLFACGGSKPAPSVVSPIVSEDAPAVATSQVDSLKQAAEAAEFEAHRLREELNRKQNAP